jgi:CHAD domain-containing protein/CYTH domain-containing protein
MTELTQEMLDRRPEETARLLALSFIGEAEAALARIKDPTDVEALHDFRVGLRRLRSGLRAYRVFLKDSTSKRLINQVADLASATGAGRDAEVLIAWLHSVEPLLIPEHQSGYQWLLGRLEAKREEAYSDVTKGISRRFQKLKADLTDRLMVYQLAVETDPASASSTFRQKTGDLVLEHMADLRSSLEAVQTLEDEEHAHRARIRGKRLRYLLEPLRHEIPEVRGMVKQLKRLQDILGDLNDLRVLSGEIASGLEAAAVERARRLHDLALHTMVEGAGIAPFEDADEAAGLLGLVELVRDNRSRLFEDLRSEWLGTHGNAFFESVNALGRSLRSSGIPGLEIERKYLLTGLPERARAEKGVWVSQGWLPGDSINERIRRTRTENGERYYRTIKMGTQLSRIEVEEKIPRSLFRTLWPLTEGRRIRKRRHVIEDGGFIWEIDNFADMNLVMAEVELPSEETEVEPPEWLVPYVVEEVTGRKEYQNLYLARHGHRRRAKRRR